MENVVTLGEIFAKAQDSLTPSFNQVKFETDVDNLSKAETENLLGTIQAEIIKGGDYDILTEMRSIALDHITDIEKAVYADNALNRKLGRVGQEYGGKGSRGGKTDDEHQSEWSSLSRKNKKEEKNKYVDDYKSQIMRRFDVDEKTAKKNAIKLTELVGKMDAGTLDFGEGNKQIKAIYDSMKDKRKEEDKKKVEKNNEEYNEANKNKKQFIKELKSEGANSNTSRFMSKNQEYFKDVLKKHDFEDFNDFEDWGADHSDNDKDIRKYNRIFMQCVNRIPVYKFSKKNESVVNSSSDIGNRIISALKADQGGLNNSSAAKKAQMKIVAAAENFMKKNPKVKLSNEDLENIVGGDIDEVEEKYGELNGWNKLNDAIELYFDAD